MSRDIERPDWSAGDGTGSDRAGAGHVDPEPSFTPAGDPKKGAQRYSGALADLASGEEKLPGDLENVEEQQPANSPEVTPAERQALVEGIEEHASEPTPYEDLSEDTKELLDEGQYENVALEIAGAKEHLTHEEFDQLQASVDGLPAALNSKLLVALGSGEYDSVLELVEHLSDGLTAIQTAHLRRAIEEMPAGIREEIGF